MEQECRREVRSKLICGALIKCRPRFIARQIQNDRETDVWSNTLIEQWRVTNMSVYDSGCCADYDDGFGHDFCMKRRYDMLP